MSDYKRQDKGRHNPAMEMAFKKAFEGIRKIQPAPFTGKLPVEKIQRAVDTVSKKDD
jgi:hypothetical protein